MRTLPAPSAAKSGPTKAERSRAAKARPNVARRHRHQRRQARAYRSAYAAPASGVTRRSTWATIVGNGTCSAALSAHSAAIRAQAARARRSVRAVRHAASWRIISTCWNSTSGRSLAPAILARSSSAAMRGSVTSEFPATCTGSDDFKMDDQEWESLLIPINLAFFVHSSAAGRVVAQYPSPGGAMESSLDLEYWDRIVERNPILKKFEPDVEALLVNRISRFAALLPRSHRSMLPPGRHHSHPLARTVRRHRSLGGD